MAALGGDAARQAEAVRTTFAAGIERLLGALIPEDAPSDGPDAARVRATHLDLLAHAVGAVVLSRACPDDSPLADEILAACREKILGSLHASSRTCPAASDDGSRAARRAADPADAGESRARQDAGSANRPAGVPAKG